MANKTAAGGFLRVGVTGGIGTGKTTVCNLFRSLGRHVVWADLLARGIADTDAGVKSRIRGVFGRDAYDASGRLDRKAIGALVFSHPDLLEQLNAIVHPAVFESVESEILSLPPEKRYPYVVIEAALLFESGYDSRMDHTIVVQAGEGARVSRIMARDRLTATEVRRRMRAQLPTAEKVRRADFVIENEGAPQDLLPGVRFLDRVLTAMALGKEKSR